MSNKRYIKERDLPAELEPIDAVTIGYGPQLTRAADALVRGQHVLISTDLMVSTFVSQIISDRLKNQDQSLADRIRYIDSAPLPEMEGAAPSQVMMAKIRMAINNPPADDSPPIIMIPFLGVLVSGSGSLTMEARQFAQLVGENPEEAIWFACMDRNIVIPDSLSKIFGLHERCEGIARERLPQLVTREHARKFSAAPNRFDPFGLHQLVSGLNPFSLIKALDAVNVAPYIDPDGAYDQLAEAATDADVERPDIGLDDDIGGYQDVKDKLNDEIISFLERLDEIDDPVEYKKTESMIPRGILLHGPPGTGKTLFAKALATAINGVCIVVNGPELKSKFVGESEENIRRVFRRARRNAPAVIVFDEIDSLAPARDMYSGGNGVTHAMVNQLLTELDGFRKDELVFVIGTTNFPSSLDPALLRDGRLGHQIYVGYPDDDARRAILNLYNDKQELEIDDDAMTTLVRRTAGPTPNTGTRYTGAALAGLCSALARYRIRERVKGVTTKEHIDALFDSMVDRPDLNEGERRTVAVHEAGHAVVALHLEHAPPISRVTIEGDVSGALGYVAFDDPKDKYVQTKPALLDRICTMLGGRAAEEVVLKVVCAGASDDIARATRLATAMVTQLGMGASLAMTGDTNVPASVSEARHAEIEGILKAQLTRAKGLIETYAAEHAGMVEVLLNNGSYEVGGDGELRVEKGA
jgi:cell division protease FtsH